MSLPTSLHTSYASVVLQGIRATGVVRQGETQNVTETEGFDYIAAAAALQRSASRPKYAFQGRKHVYTVSSPAGLQ